MTHRRPPLHDVSWSVEDEPRALMSWGDVFGALVTFGFIVVLGYLIAGVIS